jgi:hypothetical protein
VWVLVMVLGWGCKCLGCYGVGVSQGVRVGVLVGVLGWGCLSWCYGVGVSV